MNFFSFFGGGKLKNALRKGAIVIDVRTPYEFDKGKFPGSINIPKDRISINKNRIKEINGPVIVCSNSAYESSIAIRMIKETGIKEVYNGGSWIELCKLQHKI